jgi:ElaB/YqjD/DUF883 family membrane-anchored ribosome-binding protein
MLGNATDFLRARSPCTQRESEWNKVIAAQFSLQQAHLARPSPYKEHSMSNTPGAQAQANKHAVRNRPSDIDELRDNIADIAGSVGDMASGQYEQAYDVAIDTVEETGQIIRRNPLGSIGVGLGVGFLLGFILTGGRPH